MKKTGLLLAIILGFSLEACSDSKGKIKNGVWKCSSIEQFAVSDGVSILDLGYEGEISHYSDPDDPEYDYDYVKIVFELDGHKSIGKGKIYLEDNKITDWQIHCSKEDGEYWFDEISDAYKGGPAGGDDYEFLVKDSDEEGRVWLFEIDLPDANDADDGYIIDYGRKKGSMKN